MTSNKSDELHVVRGRSFYETPFYNIILSTNIAIYRYLAQFLFDGNMDRVVWASMDMMFRRRQEQLSNRKIDTSEINAGLLDFPFCAFRLTQDGVKPGTDRNWWNPALYAKGIWIDELEKRIKITPVTFNYEACFCCSHDSDLYRIQQKNLWEVSAETILESYIDIIDDEKVPHTLKNIIIYNADSKMNSSFNEKDWLEKNKVQTINLDISCQTWLIDENLCYKYALTKNFLFDFLDEVTSVQFDSETASIEDAGQLVKDIFMDISIGDNSKN